MTSGPVAIRLKVVLKRDHDTVVGAVHILILHPIPLQPAVVDLIIGNQLIAGFQIQETALHEGLHRGDVLLDTRGQLARPHLHIGQILRKKVSWLAPAHLRSARRGKVTRYESGALLLA